MHELSLVDALCRQVIEAAEPATAAELRLIRVEAGPLSGVEPLLVQLAFETRRSSWGLQACQLQINEVPLRGVCRQCQAEFEIRNFMFRCALCASNTVQVTQGDEFRLLSIDIDAQNIEPTSPVVDEATKLVVDEATRPVVDEIGRQYNGLVASSTTRGAS